MMNISQIFEQLIAKQSLNPHQIQEVMEACISGELNDVQIATFLALMRSKGESVEELTAAAELMQRLAHPINLGTKLIDIVGTGGDGKNTFNVSTASSFVIASTGISVAKHGSRSVSSKSGSSDVLEQAGFQLHLSDEQLKICMTSCHLAFLFAPQFHPAMKQVRSARSQLGIRSLFNVLGPLINPALVKRQVVGVFSVDFLKPIASILSHLGRERVLVISSLDGLDEISIAAPSTVLEYDRGHFKQWQINPEDYGLAHPNIESIVVDSPKQSLKLIQSVLAKEAGPARDMVVLNAASAIYCANDDLSYAEAITFAQKAIDSGNAYRCFDTLRLLSQSFKE